MYFYDLYICVHLYIYSPILQDAGNLSLFLQAIVKFDLNGDTFYTRNVRSVQHAKILSDEDLKSCLYQNNDSKFRYCPRFLVRDVVRFSGTDYENGNYVLNE